MSIGIRDIEKHNKSEIIISYRDYYLFGRKNLNLSKN